MQRNHPWVLFAVASLLLATGCEFWKAPDPEPEDPNEDGVLRCGDVENLTGYAGGAGLEIDVSVGTGVELRPDFADPSHAARLAVQDDSSLQRALEIWDPVSQSRVIPGFAGNGDQLSLELIASNGQRIDGTVTVTCSDPGESCFNLADDDGDGLVDCADIGCARDSGCADDQEDLETVVVQDCTTEALTPPVLTSIDDQRTIYTTDLSGDGPAQEFWGGAEIVLTSAPEGSVVHLAFDSAGLVCVGADNGDSVTCTGTTSVEAGSEIDIAAVDLPAWLEPLDPSWTGVTVSVDCADGR